LGRRARVVLGTAPQSPAGLAQESRRAGVAEARVRELEDGVRKLRLQLTQAQEEAQRL
jgi:hypothetical protein